MSLGREAAKNDADLLIVVIPSWNEIMEVGAEDRPELQRKLIKEAADELDNVYVLDPSEEIRGLGACRVYGQVDKHFNSFGDRQIHLRMDAARLAEGTEDDAAGAAVRRRSLGNHPAGLWLGGKLPRQAAAADIARRRRRPGKTKERLAPPG